MVKNPALLYVTLSWVAAYIECPSGGGERESYSYLQSSVSALNEELSRPCSDAFTEGTIAAVAAVVNMEVPIAEFTTHS
jgi:hypothetical protein